jgi:hypothetical protein
MGELIKYIHAKDMTDAFITGPSPSWEFIAVKPSENLACGGQA